VEFGHRQGDLLECRHQRGLISEIAHSERTEDDYGRTITPSLMPGEDGSGTFPVPLVRAVQPSESETRLDGDGQILAMFDEYVTAHPMIDRASHLHASRYLSVRNLPRMAEQLLPVRQREAAIPGCREPHDSRSNVAVRILEVVSLREQWFVDRHEPPAQRKPPPRSHTRSAWP
jgi:hypothetical protein